MAGGWSLNVSPQELLQRVGIPARVSRAVRGAGLILVHAWKDELSHPGQGEFYAKGTRFITKGGRTFAIQDDELGRPADHRASAPGDPPAVDRGELRNSIDMESRGEAEVRIGSGDFVALALEFGVNTEGSRVGPHPGGIVIEPRPHGRPAKDNAAPAMREHVKSVLRGQ